MTYRLLPDTRRRLHELDMHVSSCWQPECYFKDDGRKLKRVAQDCDPWVAQVFYPEVFLESGRPIAWWPAFTAWGKGNTADEAVNDALDQIGGVDTKIKILGCELERLAAVLRVSA